MKELSIEERAKRYDKLFVKASRIYNKENDVLILHTIEDLFPELKESKDERIRKELIKFLQECHNIDSGFFSRYCEIPFAQTLAWLEKQDEQKPAWSAEDERHFSWLIEHLSQSAGLYDNLIDWLKSLKDRYTWKPSDEQMKQLGWIAEQNKDNMIGKELISLYQDLKKLREG